MTNQRRLGTLIYMYDPKTGKYKDKAESYRELEEKYGLYKGAVSDGLRRPVNAIRARRLLVSKQKYDVHPAYLDNGNVEPEQIKTLIPQGTLTEEQLRKKHDMFFIVFEYVKNIPEGKFVEESQMLREVGLLGKPRYRDAISRHELKEFKGKVDGTIYYGNQESIKKLKLEGVLQ